MADASGGIIRKYFRTPVSIDAKADASPVTIADREVETAQRELLASHVPEHGIYGEEHGRDRLDADYVWVLDPIDGTRSFITGVPLFGVIIGLVHKGETVMGVLDQPILGERWIGIRGTPSTLNGEIISTRACGALAGAMLATTSLEDFPSDAERSLFARVHKAAGRARHITDCYSYAMLATGFVDMVVEAGLKPYDYCGLVPIVEGAGGVMTDWTGAPLGIESDGRVLAAGDRAAHALALDLLKTN